MTQMTHAVINYSNASENIQTREKKEKLTFLQELIGQI